MMNSTLKLNHGTSTHEFSTPDWTKAFWALKIPEGKVLGLFADHGDAKRAKKGFRRKSELGAMIIPVHVASIEFGK
jgi:hypothetical protein